MNFSPRTLLIAITISALNFAILNWLGITLVRMQQIGNPWAIPLWIELVTIPGVMVLVFAIRGRIRSP